LDAYIYKQGGDEEKVEDVKNDVHIEVHPVATALPDIPFSIASLVKSSPKESKQTLHIFTDGACTNNGKKFAKAAWAFVVVDKDQTTEIGYNSEKLKPFEPQTNQRAELNALLHGLQYAVQTLKTDSTPITIWSDSEYAIHCTSKWGPTWWRNDWKKKGGEIQHLDLIRELVPLYSEHKVLIELKWIEAHTQGARQSQFPWCWNHRVDQAATDALNVPTLNNY
jgi:ribonuclease HI